MSGFLNRSRQHESRHSAHLPGGRDAAANATSIDAIAQLRVSADASAPVQKLQAMQRLADHHAGITQRQIDDEELMQGKAMQRVEEEEPLQGDTLQRQEAAPSNRHGLPADLQRGIESLSGLSMADVRVHRNSDRPAQVGAHAFAQGRDIHLGAGQEKHLPHEAWHVVQQAQGRVQPTTTVNGTSVNDDPGLESEADRMGSAALSQAPMSGDGFLT